MVIGDRIKKVRNELKLTQKEFATKLGISRSNLSDMENGRNKAENINILKKLSEISNKSIDYFIKDINSFENRLKNYRKNLGLKKRELADKLEISESYYNMIENGKRNPSKSFIIKLVNYSNKPEEYWVYGILKNSIYMKKIEYCLINKEKNLLCKNILRMLDDIDV